MIKAGGDYTVKVMKVLLPSGRSGFTIVELIIVIVVIAILAGLTIVGYGTIRDNAYNNQVIAGVTQYKDAIDSYKAFFHKYPQTTREINGQQIAVTCLGTGYSGGYCGKVTNVDIYEDSAFNAELAKIAKGASISADNLKVGAETFTGAVYGIDQVDSSKSPTLYARTIQYALKGSNTDCKIEGAWSYALSTNPAITACEIILETVPAR